MTDEKHDRSVCRTDGQGKKTEYTADLLWMARQTDRPMSAVKKLHREGICLSVHPIEETDGMSIFDIPLVMPASPDRQEVSPDQRFHIRLVCPRKHLEEFVADPNCHRVV